MTDVLGNSVLERLKVSVAVAPASGGKLLFAVEPDAHRVPASNAKVLTSLAAALVLPGRYQFSTEVSRHKHTLYLYGTGDPLLKHKDLAALAAAVRAGGVRRIRGIVVDDRAFGGKRQLAPGFESFKAAAYRPSSAALNLNSNSIRVSVTPGKGKRPRPKIEVTPASDYVIVKRRVRQLKGKGKLARRARITAVVKHRGRKLIVTVSGVIGSKAKLATVRKGVPDPSLNVGWALSRALAKAGVKVRGGVRRGTRPATARVVAKRVRPLHEVLRATNSASNNLAAENLVRAMGSVGGANGSWSEGMKRLRATLVGLGLSDFALGNGSGLHRGSWVTTRLMVQLLQTIYARPGLRRTLIPTLAVAGKRGTLGGRLRGTAAAGIVHAKTGTLGGALALSGIVDPEGSVPLAFSVIVNGSARKIVRRQIDRLAELLARYVKGLALEAPASQPADVDEETDEDDSADDEEPSSSPTSQPAAAAP